MKSKIKYTEEPMGELRVIDDFLPPPDQLVLKEENVKVTIALKKSSIEFFMDAAKVVNDMNFPGSDLHRLKGKIKDLWSVKVSGNWAMRLNFDILPDCC